MKLVTASQMQALDSAAVEKYKIRSLDLMERAGKGTADAVLTRFPKKGPVIIFAGKGNNGGDGLVTARYLKNAGFNVSIYLLSPWTEFSPDARINWDRLAGLNVEICEIVSEHELKNDIKKFEKAVCIIDAIFGTGLSSEVKGKYKSVIEFINSLIKPVIAVDIPSGISADTGQPLGTAIRAKLTVTFGMAKVGCFTNIGAEYAQKVLVVDIGIPKELTERANTGYFLIMEDMFAPSFGKRVLDSHKGDFGHVLVIGGSSGKIGAGLLTAKAALRAGAGLVTYALPHTAYVKFDTKSPEIMYEGVADHGLGRFCKESLAPLKVLAQNKKVLAIGPGIGTEKDTTAVIIDFIKKDQLPSIIDADGLNCLAGDIGAISVRKNPVILTPHLGEMARLTGLPSKNIQADRIAAAKNFAKAHRVYLVLKGHRTIVASPEGNIFINPTGNPGMATAGTGDVLTGVIAGFIAQDIPVETAVIAGVYLHGLAGDLAAKDLGVRGLIASDVINCLPLAMKTVVSDQ